MSASSALCGVTESTRSWSLREGQPVAAPSTRRGTRVARTSRMPNVSFFIRSPQRTDTSTGYDRTRTHPPRHFCNFLHDDGSQDGMRHLILGDGRGSRMTVSAFRL